MKPVTAYATIWISVACVAIVGVLVTESIAPMFALFIPVMISFSGEEK